MRSPLRFAAALLALSACDASAVGTGAPDAGAGPSAAPDLAAPSPPDLAPSGDLAPPLVDEDGDGLDDAKELQVAAEYLPHLSIAKDDGCETMGLLVRVRPHPKDRALIHVLYDQLYDRDCGTGGHPGDNEAFGVTVDPSRPAPDGIVAIKAISHQNTPCQRISECGRCPGQRACAQLTPDGQAARPAVWPSRAKHGTYVNRTSTCDWWNTCFDGCYDNTAPRRPPIVNAGEPGRPLVRDLTAAGFITAQNGWKSMALFGYDPWSGKNFGSAGNVAGDLVDPAFETPACR